MVFVRAIGVNMPTTCKRLDGLFELPNVHQFELVVLRMNGAHSAKWVRQAQNSSQKGRLDRDCLLACTARTIERILPPLKSTGFPFLKQLPVAFFKELACLFNPFVA